MSFRVSEKSARAGDAKKTRIINMDNVKDKILFT